MAERNEDLNVRVRFKKEGDEVIADATKDVSKFEEEIKSAAEASARLTEKAQGTFRGMGPAAASARNEIENLRKSMEATAAAGGEIDDKAVAALKNLENEYERSIAKAGQYRKAQQDVKLELSEATEAAGGYASRISSLDDLIREITEEFGAGAVKMLSWGTAAVGTFKVAYEAATKFREAMNEFTGGKFDEFIKNFMVFGTSINEVAGALAGGSESLEDAAQRTKNELNILAKNGFDVAGLSAEQAHQKFLEFTGGLSKARFEMEEVAKAAEKLVDSMGVKSKEELDKQAKVILEAIRQVKEANKNLTEEDIAKLFGEQVDKLLKEYDKIKEQAPEAIQEVERSWEFLAETVKTSVDSQVLSIGRVPQALEQMKQALEKAAAASMKATGQIPEELKKQAEQLTELGQVWNIYGSEVQDVAMKTAKAVGGVTLSIDLMNESLLYLERVKFSEGLVKELEKVDAAAAAAAASLDKAREAAAGFDDFGNYTEFGYGIPGAQQFNDEGEAIGGTGYQFPGGSPPPSSGSMGGG